MASRRSQRVGRVLLVLGMVAGAFAIASVVVLFWYFSLPIDRGFLANEQTIRGGLFLSEDTVSEGGIVVAIPGGIALIASCFLFPGFFLSRGGMGLSSHNRLGGSVVARYALLSTRASLSWIAVAIIGWLGIMVVPLASQLSGGWPAQIDEDARGYIFIVAGLYGSISAGLAAVLAVSLLKKRRQLGLIAAADPRLSTPDSSRAFWRWYCYRWRIDSWCAFLGGAGIGVSVLAVTFGAPAIFLILVGASALLCGVAIATSRQFWRSGEELGSAEGFA